MATASSPANATASFVPFVSEVSPAPPHTPARSASRVSKFLLHPRATASVLLAVGLPAAALTYPLSAALSPRALLQMTGGLHLTWLGLISAIAFIEAPVKFHAPTVSRVQALDIGRHVFSALNKAEVVLACMSAAMMLRDVEVWGGLARWIPSAAVGVQSLAVLPGLMRRANVLVQVSGETGAAVALKKDARWHHAAYATLEMTKIAALAWIGARCLRLAIE